MVKKKTKAKVARPIATTSIPSTARKIEPQVEQSGTKETIAETSTQEISQPSAEQSAPQNEQLDNPLQVTLDSILPKVEKEISRLAKNFDTDIRFARSDTFQSIQMVSDQVNSVLKLATAEGSPIKSNIGDSGEKALTNLAISYGSLRHLGYSTGSIDQCFQEISGVSLDESLEWLALNGPPEDLASLKDLSPLPLTEKHTLAVSSPPQDDIDKTFSARSPTLVEDSDTDPNEDYARIQLEIDGMTINRRPGDTTSHESLRTLRQQLQKTSQSILFDQSRANELYNAKRASDGTPTRQEGSNIPQPATVPEPEDFFDESDTEGGMFDILETPSSIQTEQGRTIKIREFTLSKHIASLPKFVLQTQLTKLDDRASLSFDCQSFGIRAHSAQCIVHLFGQKRIYSMPDDVACPDQAQAIQYAALLALNNIITPGSGNYLFRNASKTTTGFLSQLPPSFRDAWDELEHSKSNEANETNLATLAHLQNIIESKTSLLKTTPGKSTAANKLASSAPKKSLLNQESPEKLQSFALERQKRRTYQAMLAQRSALPIAAERENIIQLLQSEQILIVCGETGSGKSTQLPTYILEHELSQGRDCKVICTEPRRLSAVSLAKRCSAELGEDSLALGTTDSLIGYSIRLENKVSPMTRLTFVTHGIAMRMFSNHSSVDDITHLIIDEVHERSADVDFLLLILKSLLLKGPTFKIILMSATAESEKLSRYFGFAKTMYISGRTFPVDVHFLEDAVEETGWSYTKIPSAKQRDPTSRDPPSEELDEAQLVPGLKNVIRSKKYSEKTIATMKIWDDRFIPYELIVEILRQVCLGAAPRHQAVLVFFPGLREILTLSDMLDEDPSFNTGTIRVFPLHSTLSSEAQNSVFERLPPGMVKIVLATNIAETGITISDITCVIDTCRHREMRYQRQANRLLEMFISKANALQRRGRAGRVQPGECYHLCSMERYEKLPDYPIPEILRVNLTDIALNIKSLDLELSQQSIAEVLSQAPDPPPASSVQRAVSMLIEVGALTTHETLTSMGRQLALLPADLHLSKLLLMAVMLRCLDSALTIAAVLTSRSPFVKPLDQEKQADAARARFQKGNSDFLTLHSAFSSWRTACTNGISASFCRKNFLSEQTLIQVEELRQQFVGYLIDSGFIKVDRTVQQEARRLQASRGRRRQRPQFLSLPNALCTYSDCDLVVSAALTAGFYPRAMKIEGKEMRTITNNQSILFHPTSVNSGIRWSEASRMSTYWVYYTLMQSQNKKVYANESGPANPLALILLCGEPEFKLVSSSIHLGKVRFKGSAKEVVALKILRARIDSIMTQMLRKAELTASQTRWLEVACRLLGKLGSQLNDGS